MNKYQEYLISQLKRSKEGIFLFANCAPVGEICKDDTYGSYNAETNCFLIKQAPDITKTEYELAISKNTYPFIAAVKTKKNNLYSDIPLSSVSVSKPINVRRASQVMDERFIIKVNFNDRIDAIKLSFIKNIADDVEITIAYQEADKQAYTEKQKIIYKENMLKRAAIKHSTGESLVNIYFQPCADNYDHTEISLFIPDKTETVRVGGPHDSIDQENVLSWALIMKTTVENGVFFKSVPGLAYGRYAYIVKQFDKGNNALIETDYTEFCIQRQQPPVIDSGNIVVI